MFLSMMSSRIMQVDSEDNLSGAFKVFDPELSGYIDPSKLRTALTTLGEPLNNAEWDEFASACVKDNQVDYQMFVNTLFSKKL
jgi:Ca2+-binding EF-hand superfamily protein